jgi:hypothetical protein
VVLCCPAAFSFIREIIGDLTAFGLFESEHEKTPWIDLPVCFVGRLLRCG